MMSVAFALSAIVTTGPWDVDSGAIPSEMSFPPIWTSMMQPSAVLSFTTHASFQSVGDGAVVLLGDSGQLFTCNETTEAFLKKVDGQRPFEEIFALFKDEFEVDEATARRDLAELADTLITEGILAVK